MEYTSYKENNMNFQTYLSKCFMWMFLGLLSSFGISALFSYTGLFYSLIMNMGISFILISSIVEIILVIALSRSIMKINTSKAITLFFIYSLVNGITLSSIFYLYDLTSIIYVFLGAAAIFGMMSIVGYTTKLDLSKLSTFITVALVAMLLVGIVMMFTFSEVAYTIYSLVGIGLFMIITTYDIHIIKRKFYETSSNEQKNALAIYGALQLYLDFINIFLHLLQLFGSSRD